MVSIGVFQIKGRSASKKCRKLLSVTRSSCEILRAMTKNLRSRYGNTRDDVRSCLIEWSMHVFAHVMHAAKSNLKLYKIAAD